MRGVKLATHLRLVERLIMSGETPLFSLYVFKMWPETILLSPSDIQVKFRHIILSKDGLDILLAQARKNSVMGDI